MAVVDASVHVALLNRADAHHGAAWAWYRQALDAGEPLAAPWLVVAEVAAALRRGTGSPALAERAVAQLIDDALLELVAVDAALATDAARLVMEQGLRGCDAVYAALAVARGTALVTFDRDQADRAASVAEVVQP